MAADHPATGHRTSPAVKAGEIVGTLLAALGWFIVLLPIVVKL